jgi:F-type H+-transporting ATPase subunit gamma
MPSLKDIKLRITSTKNTQKTTRAMKMVSASKLRRAQERAIKLRPYATKLNQVLQRVLAGIADTEVQNPYTELRAVQNVLIVLVTSNKGLAGQFNIAITRLALAHAEAKYPEALAEGRVSFLCIGRKGYDYLKARKYPLVGENHDAFSKISADYVGALADSIAESFTDGTYDRIDLVYNAFRTILAQDRMAETYLPIDLGAAQATDGPTDYLFEPERAEILDSILPLLLKLKLYRAVLESNSAEHGARMVAMDNATENAQDLLGQLRLSYNKARQAAITKELIEIVSGAEALNG